MGKFRDNTTIGGFIALTAADIYIGKDGIDSTKLTNANDLREVWEKAIESYNLAGTKLDATAKAVNAGYADKWTNARTLTFNGDVSGSVSIDGTVNKTVTLNLDASLHNHDTLYYTKGSSDTKYFAKTGGAIGGNVTIGNGTGQHVLTLSNVAVEGNMASRIEFKLTDSQNVQIRHNSHNSVRAPFGLHIEKTADNDEPENKAYLDVEGMIYCEKVHNPAYADYAEYFETPKKKEGMIFSPGMIVMLDTSTEEDTYKVCDEDCSPLAIGVVSDEYGHILGGGDDLEEKEHAPIGLAGRVHVNILGAIEKGDHIVSAYGGFGRKFVRGVDDHLAIIGMALESANPEGDAGSRVRMLIK